MSARKSEKGRTSEKQRSASARKKRKKREKARSQSEGERKSGVMCMSRNLFACARAAFGFKNTNVFTFCLS